MFTAALFTIARTQKQHKCPTTDERVKKMWCIYAYCMLSCSVVSDSLQPHGLKPARLLCPWDVLSQEYKSESPFPSPGDLPDPGTELKTPASPALAGGFFTTVPPGTPLYTHTHTHTHICNEMLLSHRKYEIIPLAATWIDLEIIILNEVSQTKTNIEMNLHTKQK